MADLPHFNPDDDRHSLPKPIVNLRIVLERAGAVIVESACEDVPVPREAVCPNGRTAAPRIRAVIGRATGELLEAVKVQRERTTTRERT